MIDEDVRRFFSIGERSAGDLRDNLENSLKAYSGDERKAAETANLLVAKYSETHRVYHNLWHIQVLANGVEGWSGVLKDDESVYFAVWFHDAIYDPRTQTNETESAALAVKSLSKLNFPPAKIERVEKMILATQRHEAEGLDEDGRLFLDFDLSILGADSWVYKKYARAIREEYSFVPENIYREKRVEILQKFLQREKIYYASKFRERNESTARANIADEIEELS